MSAVAAIYVDGAFHPIEPVQLPDNCEVNLQFEVRTRSDEATARADNGANIEDKLAALAAQVPMEEWKRLPDDLSDQLDHYVYGTPLE